MQAELFAVGTELLMGEIVDTNSAYLAGRLPALGVRVGRITQVGDDLEDLLSALQEGWRRADLLVTTGGLGPTEDDRTREAIALLVGEEMFLDETLVRDLEAFFRRRGYRMPESNLRQAMRIPSATALPNPHGTAPGWWVEKEEKVIVALPGVPHEMKHLWEAEVEPRLRRRVRGAVILKKTLKTFGASEASVNEQVQDLFRLGNPALGIYARADGIHLRLTATAPSEEEARALLEPAVRTLRERLGPLVWGEDEDTPEVRLGTLLRERGLTLAVMESCTGGLLASTLTDVPGSSHYFVGGVVGYATGVKTAMGVDPALVEEHGVVSPQVAEAMARAVRERLGADLGIGITGVAGPDPQEGKPPGLVHIGLAWPGGSRSVTGRYPPNRLMVKRRAVVHALLEMYRIVQDLPTRIPRQGKGG